MKSLKKITFTLACLLLFSGAKAQVQEYVADSIALLAPKPMWQIGLVAAVGQSKSTIADSPQKLKWRRSGQVGVCALYNFKDKKNYAYGSLVLNQRGYNIEYTAETLGQKGNDTIVSNIKGFQNMFYIDLPVGLGRKFGNKLSVYGGLTFSLRAFSVFDYSGKTLYKTPDSTYTTIIKERDYSNNAIDLADIAFSAGLRYQLSKKAAITANFSRDLLGIGISEENFITNKHANMWVNVGVEFYLFKSKSLL